LICRDWCPKLPRTENKALWPDRPRSHGTAAMLAEAGDPRRRSGTPFRARDGTLALLLCFSAARSTPQKRRRGTLLVLGDGSKQAPATLHGANSQIFPPAAFPTPHHLRPAAMAEHWDRHRRLPFSSISLPIDQVARRML
jgi:hypothetical protein